MKERPIAFLIACFVLFIAGLLQSTEIVSFFGVKPNLALVLLIAGAFWIVRAWELAIFCLIALGSIYPYIGGALEATVLLVAGLSAWLFGHRLSAAPLWNVVIFLVLGTVFTYVVSDIKLIASDPFVFLSELGYNVLIGVIAFFVGTRIFYDAYETRLRNRA